MSTAAASAYLGLDVSFLHMDARWRRKDCADTSMVSLFTLLCSGTIKKMSKLHTQLGTCGKAPAILTLMAETSFKDRPLLLCNTYEIRWTLWGLLCAFLIFAGCTTDGGQSGGESDSGCHEKSRVNVSVDNIASGFDLSPTDAMKDYTHSYAHVLKSIIGERVGDITFVIRYDAAQGVEVIRREYRADASAQAQTDITAVTPDELCKDVYSIPIDVALNAAADDSAVLSISAKTKGKLLINPSGTMTSLTKAKLDAVQTSAMPKLISKGYTHIELVLALDGSTNQMPNTSVSGRLFWQGEHEEDDVASSNNEDIGSFTNP